MPDDEVAEDLETEPTEVEEGDDGEDRSPLTRDDLDDGPNPTSTKVRIALLIVVAIVAGFLIARATSGGDDGGGDDGGTDDGATAATGEGVPFPTGDVNRTGYWGFVSLTPIVIDTFDRQNDPESLGDGGDGGTWDPVNGTWGVRDDAAATSGGTGEGPFLAVVPGGGRGDGLTEVTMTVVEDGAGLVFRYLDPENHWSIVANQGVGTWTVNRTIEGDTEVAGEFPGPTNDDVTISVEQKGSGLRFMADGIEFGSIPADGALADQLQGGLIAAGTTQGEARWNRFLVMTYGADSGGGATTTTAPA